MNYKEFSIRIGFASKSYSEKKNILAKLHGSYDCIYCGAPGYKCLEHVIPQAHGGTNGLENIVLACYPCNLKKRGDALETLAKRDPEFAKTVEAVHQKLQGTITLQNVTDVPALQHDALETFIKTTDFGAILEKYRREKRISKERIRKELKLGGWTWDRWVTGAKLMREDNLYRIIKFLDIPEPAIVPRYIELKRRADIQRIKRRAERQKGRIRSKYAEQIEGYRKKLHDRRVALGLGGVRIQKAIGYRPSVFEAGGIPNYAILKSYCGLLDIDVHEVIAEWMKDVVSKRCLQNRAMFDLETAIAEFPQIAKANNITLEFCPDPMKKRRRQLGSLFQGKLKGYRKRLHDTRIEKNLSLLDVKTKTAGYDMAGFERGTIPRYPNLKKVCASLDIPIEEILNDWLEEVLAKNPQIQVMLDLETAIAEFPHIAKRIRKDTE